jgi:hypothetical protein
VNLAEPGLNRTYIRTSVLKIRWNFFLIGNYVSKKRMEHQGTSFQKLFVAAKIV